MKTAARAPRAARWLLERALPPDVRDGVTGDLDEVFARQCEQAGRLRAGLWYWGETASFSTRFLAERMRGRARGMTLGMCMSWLDIRLAVRMLSRYPGLTLVGGLAMSVAIALGAAFFEFAHDHLDTTLPFRDGDRIVGIQNWNRETGRPEPRSLHEFAAWREQLRSVRELGAFSLVERNLIVDGGRTEPVTVAEISASAFRVTGVSALLGRTLEDADERPGALPVAVIGHDLWQSRLGGDAAVLGRAVQLDDARATVVGVMPPGFAFPVQNTLWTPLQVNTAAHGRRDGPALQVFGLLAPGVRMEQAQAELSAIGSQAAADFPEANRHLRPRLVPYTGLFVPREIAWQLYLGGVVFVMFLVVVCANVATLIFARNATRETEISVRAALGASRGRIVTQLFLEALVLASAAAALGLLAASWGLRAVMDVFWAVQESPPPFWWDDGLSATTVMFAAVLTLLGAVIAGIPPALKVTGREVQNALRSAGARGSSLRMGGGWTAVIVVQVALTVAFIPTAIGEGLEAIKYRGGGVGIPAAEFLSARLALDTRTEAPATFAELRRQLDAAPGVQRVSFADLLPGMKHPVRWVEIDGAPRASTDARVRTAAVDVDFFQAAGAPVLSGRAFRTADLETAARAVIVNQSFVRQVLGGRNPLGQRVRYAAADGHEPGPWHEIVGMVPDLGLNPSDPDEAAGLYHPASPGSLAEPRLLVRVGGNPASLAPQLRSMAAAVNPALRLYDVLPLDAIGRTEQIADRVVLAVLMGIALLTLVLSTVGIYSLMAFTVSQRTREIGIRVALGADPRQIVSTIFSRATVQLGLGVLAGGAGAALLASADGEQMQVALLVVVAALMLFVGLLACAVPVRRVLRIHPTEALRQA